MTIDVFLGGLDRATYLANDIGLEKLEVLGDLTYNLSVCQEKPWLLMTPAFQRDQSKRGISS